MRNTTKPAVETLTQWRDQAGALWCAQVYYPNGKKDRTYTIHLVCKVGTTISIPCASVSQLWHEVNIRQQQALPGM
jgi:hypothetical protein